MNTPVSIACATAKELDKILSDDNKTVYYKGLAHAEDKKRKV